MSEVFISYSRRDKEFVQKLFQALHQHNRESWVDWQDIQPSEQWWKAIETGIEGSDTFVAILSPDYAKSPVCHRETEYAVQNHKRIIPILYRDLAELTTHPSLSAHNWIFMQTPEEFDSKFQVLLKTLDTDLRHVKGHTRLLTRALEWEREQRDPSFLLRDRDLELSEQWLANSPGKDPSPTSLQLDYIAAGQALRQHLREAEESYRRAQMDLQRAVLYHRPNPKTVVRTCLATTALVLLTRFLGVMQPLEMAAYDQFTRWRSQILPEQRDDRFLVVEITEQDIQAQERDGSYQGSLSDPTLERVLETLEPLNPRLIGLDVYRDQKVDSPTLAARMQASDRILALCKAPYGSDGELPPPPATEVPLERVGFSDVVRDQDDVVRRHLLFQDAVAGAACTAEQAFSLLLARYYLEREPGQAIALTEPDGGQPLQIGNIRFQRFGRYTGAYQFEDAQGYQILLNYRAHQRPPLTTPSSTGVDTSGPFPRITLGSLLSQPIPPEWVRDRIVLIGVSAPSRNDYFSTPFGKGDRQMLGVELQAHKASQLISAVLENRSLLWSWGEGYEALWILGWGMVGGLLVGLVPGAKRAVVAVLVGAGGVSILCFAIFTQAGWVPLVPALLNLLGTSGALFYLAFRRSKAHAPLTPTAEQKPMPLPAHH